MEGAILMPLFPLELIVYPGQKLNLHIFESRYRQLVHDCSEDKVTFGIPCYRKDSPISFGTEVELVKIAMTYPDGRMDIITRGIRPIEVNRYLKSILRNFTQEDILLENIGIMMEILCFIESSNSVC